MYSSQTFAVGLFQCNCTILWKNETKEAVIIDPGDAFEEIKDRVDVLGLNVRALWHTHAHLDHLGATHAMYELLSVEAKEKGVEPPKVYLHPDDDWLYRNIAIQSQMLGLNPFLVPDSYVSLKDAQSLEELEGSRVFHTPGHTPGSCCLYIKGKHDITETSYNEDSRYNQESQRAPLLFSGDTLFRRSIGRTDLWGGDFNAIIKSIRSKLFSLSPETIVVPGHGPLTQIGEEVEKNPFLNRPFS